MKKIYKRPTIDYVVLNLGEPIAADEWGGGATQSNTGLYTEGKDTDTVWEETDEENEAGIPTLRNSVWDEDMEKHIKPSNIFKQ